MFTYNSFCIGSMSQVIKIGTCLLVLLFMMVGGVISGCVFSIRYSKIYKDILAR